MASIFDKANELNGTQERRQHKSDPFTGRTKAPLAPLDQIPGRVSRIDVHREQERDHRLAEAQAGRGSIGGYRVA